jgi:hypothetical protein
MTFDIRISLVSPNGYTIQDKKFRFANEVEARDKLDVVMMILDKSYFETYAEYEKTYDAVSKVLQGYEFSIIPKGRRGKTPFNQGWLRDE